MVRVKVSERVSLLAYPHPISGKDTVAKQGDVIEVSPAHAEHLVSRGLATLVNEHNHPDNGDIGASKAEVKAPSNVGEAKFEPHVDAKITVEQKGQSWQGKKNRR